MRYKLLSLFLLGATAVPAHAQDYYTLQQRKSIGLYVQLLQTTQLQLQYTWNTLTARRVQLVANYNRLQTAIVNANNPLKKSLLRRELQENHIQLVKVTQTLTGPWTTFDGRVPIYDKNATLAAQIDNVQFLLSDAQAAALEAEQEANPGMLYVTGKVLYNGTRVPHTYKAPTGQ